MFKLFGLITLCLFSSQTLATGEIYKYSDINGQAYFTNKPYEGIEPDKIYYKEKISNKISPQILSYYDENQQVVFTNKADTHVKSEAKHNKEQSHKNVNFIIIK